MKITVSVTVDEELIWSRFGDGEHEGGTSIKHRETLESVVAALTEALKQAEGQLGLMNVIS